MSVLNMFHVPLNASPAPALNAPLTAFVHMYKTGSASFNEIKPAFEQIAGVRGVPGAHGGAFGKLHERDEYVLVTGWDSQEVRSVCFSLNISV